MEADRSKPYQSDQDRISDLLARIKSLEDEIDDNHPIVKFVYHSEVKPPVKWNRSQIEEKFNIKLPETMNLFWSAASEVRLFEEINYGQWGLVIWSPAEIIERSTMAISEMVEEDRRNGDLIIGKFCGDPEYVLLRCDPDSDDFGDVLMTLAIDPRHRWETVGMSIVEFLEKFLLAPQKKFWFN